MKYVAIFCVFTKFYQHLNINACKKLKKEKKPTNFGNFKWL